MMFALKHLVRMEVEKNVIKLIESEPMLQEISQNIKDQL
jgi:hypothetical protein